MPTWNEVPSEKNAWITKFQHGAAHVSLRLKEEDKVYFASWDYLNRNTNQRETNAFQFSLATSYGRDELDAKIYAYNLLLELLEIMDRQNSRN